MARITSPAATWSFVGEVFGRFFDTYILDVRGRGLSSSGPDLDYSLDTKKEKEVARAMIQLVMDLNGKFKSVGDPAVAEKTSCFTCHNGQKAPAKAEEASENDLNGG